MSVNALPNSSNQQMLLAYVGTLGAAALAAITKLAAQILKPGTASQAMSHAASQAAKAVARKTTVDAKVTQAAMQVSQGAMQITHELSVRFGVDPKLLHTILTITKWVTAGKLARAIIAPSTQPEKKGPANWPLRLAGCAAGYAAWKKRQSIADLYRVMTSVF